MYTFEICNTSLSREPEERTAYVKQSTPHNSTGYVFFSIHPIDCYLLLLKELVEVGTITPVIGRYYPLEQTVEAHTYVEAGRKKGNGIITIKKQIVKLGRDYRCGHVHLNSRHDRCYP